MTGHIQWLTPDATIGIARVFREGQGYGDRYTWCCTFQRIDINTAMVYGVLHAPNQAERAALRAAFYSAGIERLTFERYRDGSATLHSVN